MTATPALTNDIFGKYQKKIGDHLQLDRKQSEGLHTELKAFAAELLNQHHPNYYGIIVNSDPGDEHAG